jgi:hypothetical protein
LGTLSERLKNELTELGASLVGFADLRDIPENQREGFNYGISIAVAINPAIINGIGNGPTKEYYDEFNRLNSLLDSLDIKAEEIVKSDGYDALPKNRSNVRIDYRDRSTILPHKTVATRAGLGWIGKCALLVTEKFGSAIRISSVLTNAPLEIETPINQSTKLRSRLVMMMHSIFQNALRRPMGLPPAISVTQPKIWSPLPPNTDYRKKHKTVPIEYAPPCKIQFPYYKLSYIRRSISDYDCFYCPAILIKYFLHFDYFYSFLKCPSSFIYS